MIGWTPMAVAKPNAPAVASACQRLFDGRPRSTAKNMAMPHDTNAPPKPARSCAMSGTRCALTARICARVAPMNCRSVGTKTDVAPNGGDGAAGGDDARRRAEEQPAPDAMAPGRRRQRRARDAEPARLPQRAEEHRQQHERGRAVPRVEIAVADVGQEAEEARAAARRQRPPRPRLPPLQRHLGKPEVHHRDGDQHAAELDAVVDHEVDDAAPVQRAELLRGHAEERHVLRQELPGRGLKDDEAAAGRQREGDDGEERAAVAEERFEEAGIVVHQKKSFTGAMPAVSK
jgi:hypothetical protein